MQWLSWMTSTCRTAKIFGSSAKAFHNSSTTEMWQMISSHFSHQIHSQNSKLTEIITEWHLRLSDSSMRTWFVLMILSYRTRQRVSQADDNCFFFYWQNEWMSSPWRICLTMRLGHVWDTIALCRCQTGDESVQWHSHSAFEFLLEFSRRPARVPGVCSKWNLSIGPQIIRIFIHNFFWKENILLARISVSKPIHHGEHAKTAMRKLSPLITMPSPPHNTNGFFWVITCLCEQKKIHKIFS